MNEFIIVVVILYSLWECSYMFSYIFEHSDTPEF